MGFFCVCEIFSRALMTGSVSYETRIILHSPHSNSTSHQDDFQNFKILTAASTTRTTTNSFFICFLASQESPCATRLFFLRERIMNICDFPEECMGNVLVFLSLSDCLQFGRTSLRSMSEILPDLRRRRNRLLFGSEYNSSSISTSRNDHIMRVLNQVRCLCKLLPVSYPAYDSARQLLCELEDLDMVKNARNEELDAVSEKTNQNRKRYTFNELIICHRKLLEFHRLYGHLLESTLKRRHMRLGFAAGMSCSLAQYAGDVLVYTYLLDYNDLALLPSSSPMDIFSEHKLEGKAPLRNASEEAMLNYHTWVYLHSRVLRKIPFTSEQRDRLRVPFNPSWDTTLFPPGCSLPRSFLESTATLVLDDFAPLRGGAYRGRDHIRFRDMKGSELLDFSQRVESGVSSLSDTTEWLCLVHEEARKTRPMTVRDPVVSFS